jgi:ubiquinone/menaquinone biosynthesis C-methylase UbiE
MNDNGFFVQDDPHADEVLGFKIHPEWWSRKYEYPWAINYAYGLVADMGTGWMDRPFKDMLAQKAVQVYAIDADERVLSLKPYANVEYIVADMSNVPHLVDCSCDRVFCISVLEDCADSLGDILKEFYRILTDDGLAVITFDVKYDLDKPDGKYPSLDPAEFFKQAKLAGFKFDYTDCNKYNAVNSEQFNLCCYHIILEKKQ